MLRSLTSRDDSMSLETPPGILRDLGSGAENGTALDSFTHAPRKLNTEIPKVLPHERVFPIQIGSELFRLSGASLSSDAPSYFSEFFKCQLEAATASGDDTGSIRTLYIDRDPVTFKDISLHLQGYHISPRDGSHFVKLFADAQFYSLPRLISQLYEEDIFISIGHTDFQIPRDLFSDPGNSPNYFSLGFGLFFTSPNEVFPGLARQGLLRPPSIQPPAVPNRSAKIFAELLHLLRGYPLNITCEGHRAELLRDCKYFHLKGLEQKLIRHSISFNPNLNRSEIAMHLNDIRQSGISIVPESDSEIDDHSASSISWVNYARPYTDATPYELLLEISDNACRLHFSPSPSRTIRAEFFAETKVRISKLFEVIATKLNLPTTQPLGLLMKKGGRSSQPASPGNTPISEDWVRVVLSEDTAVQLDGKDYAHQIGRGSASTISSQDDESAANSIIDFEDFSMQEPNRKRRRMDAYAAVGDDTGDQHTQGTWIVTRGLWRLRISGKRDERGRGMECVLVGVKIDAVSGEGGRNRARGFLGD